MEKLNPIDFLLVGQPNVGKSVLFSKLTGINTISSNYAGTTVSYAKGNMDYNGVLYSVVDAPGTYSLEPMDDASRVAIELIDKAKLIINVVDATHLERNLVLTLELLEQGKPVVIALNMSDEARHKGIEIDNKELSKKLGVPVISTVARTGEGIKDLISVVTTVKPAKIEHVEKTHPEHHPHIPKHETANDVQEHHTHMSRKATWERIGNILSDVQTLNTRKHSFTDVLEDISVHPVFGAVLALLVLTLSFTFVRILGEFIITGGIGLGVEPWIQLPFGTELFFDKLWLPVLEYLQNIIGKESIISKILIGSLIEGKIDLAESFGILSSGVFIPLGVVLPYVFSFYFIMSILEDTGYLPRLAVFLDGIMHKIGLHGYAIIPTILGMGCNVPGILATRVLETPRQRFVVATLISIAVPCVSMQAMLIGVLGSKGVAPLLTVYAVLIAVWFIIGFILRLTAKEYRPELLIEIPPYRLPDWKALASKMWSRTYGFIYEALPIIMLSILVVDILYQTKVFYIIADLFAPIVKGLWGLPKEAIIPLLIGILRKDAAVAMFPAFMTIKQLVTASVVLAMFFPCVASFVVLVKELGWKYATKSMAIMLVSVIIVGFLVNILL